MQLTGAEVSWLAERSGRNAGGEAPNLNLEGATMDHTCLEGADLRRAHLEGANLYGAHLEQANLSYAHLEEARLTVVGQMRLQSARSQRRSHLVVSCRVRAISGVTSQPDQPPTNRSPPEGSQSL